MKKMFSWWNILVIFGFYTIYCQGQSQWTQAIKEALFLHNFTNSNYTLKDCQFRPTDQRLLCPDPDIRYILYNGAQNQIVDYTQSDWLRQSIWDHTKEDVLLIHGYAGGDNALPMGVLRDAYLTNGSYNVWVLDWGRLGPAPCYRAAVHNIKAVARCTGSFLTTLRTAGLQTDKMTCVGHSLGAHICGLDPAKPLVLPGSQLTSGDASAVHIVHTNAGHYGEGGKVGHVDFCVNGGRIQPYCQNSGIEEQLCSHVWAVCYMAESIFPSLVKKAEPCTRRCPNGPRPGHRIGVPIPMGQFTPLTAAGSYCVHDTYPPFCPLHSGHFGDKRCCLQAPEIKPPAEESTNRKLSTNN